MRRENTIKTVTDKLQILNDEISLILGFFKNLKRISLESKIFKSSSFEISCLATTYQSVNKLFSKRNDVPSSDRFPNFISEKTQD